ncbi:MAG: type VI secretion system-associated FHA domain protein TagH [Rhizobiaceae bacterium]|nr:type VI secretion system-associated FHA domain protein TagH [Rhizobiaceae bacterium]
MPARAGYDAGGVGVVAFVAGKGFGSGLMTIILTIDSVDSLPDGGPIRFQAVNRGFEIGRQQHLDWTLPDPSRYISGLHCEVRFEKGDYWLYDVSRNGTFLNGSTARMKSPYRLEHGDRLSIGHYVVLVELAGRGAGEAPADPGLVAARPAAMPDYSGDIWGTDAPAQPPIDRRDLMPPRPGAMRAPDYSNQFIAFPDVGPLPERPAPAAAPAHADPFHLPPGADPAVPPQPAPRMPDPAAPVFRAEPIARPKRLPVDGESFSSASPAAPVPAAPAIAQPFPTPRVAAPDAAAQARFIEGLAAGAGVSPETFSSRDPGEVGREVGAFLKVAVEQMAQLLRARAAAKAMTKSASRTMIGATDNNPLKFIPGSAEVIDVMFTRRRPGFLGAQESLEAGFSDLKRHELATYAAMQKALSRLLDDLSPEAISSKVGGSAFASKKSRAWDVFEERWEQKSGAGENGMLDVFLAYFAEAYDQASRKG